MKFTVHLTLEHTAFPLGLIPAPSPFIPFFWVAPGSNIRPHPLPLPSILLSCPWAQYHDLSKTRMQRNKSLIITSHSESTHTHNTKQTHTHLHIKQNEAHTDKKLYTHFFI